MTNPVATILATSGDQALLAAGNRVTALAIGQIGVFNAGTQLSIDTTATPDMFQEFFIAVGTDPTATGSLSDVRRSSGDFIVLKDINAIDFRCSSISRQEIWDITGFTANCNTEYMIRMGLAFPLAGITYGFNMPMLVFSYTTGCCDGCGTDCPSGDCNELALGMVNTLNDDENGLFVANLIDVTSTPGTPIIVAISDYTTWVAANPGLCLGIRITTVSVPMSQFVNGINIKYDYPRVPHLNISLVEGFVCNGTVTAFQAAINEQGYGYDLLEQESDDSGNTAIGKGPFRTSALIGVPFDNYESIIVKTAYYMQYTITSNQKSSNGGVRQDTMTPLETTIAIPCGDSTTADAFVALMDIVTNGLFKPMSDAEADCTCHTANTIDTLNDSTLDGDSVN